MADFDQNTYQPMDGDLYIQEVRTGRFTMYRYSFGSWEQLGAGHSEQDIKTLTEPLQFLGESKGFRRYYRPGEAKQPFKDSDLYEYTLHDETDNTLQVFTAHTMSSTYFSAKQTLDLLNFLAANRRQIEALANQLQAKREQPKTIEKRIDDLFS